MTHRSSLFLAALLATGCAPGGTLLIDSFTLPDSMCKPPTMQATTLAGGFLDVSPGSSEFFLVVQTSAFLAAGGNTGDITVSGTIVQNKNSDRPSIDALVFNYTSQPKLGKLSTFTVPVTATLDTSMGAVATANIGPLNILSSQVSSALDAIDSAGGVLTVNVTAKGHMILSGASLTSESLNFPITLVNTRSQTGSCAKLKKGTGCTYPGQGFSIADQDLTSPNFCCDNTPTAAGCN